MRVWVDADACPAVIKEILFRAAQRKQVEVTLVANHPMHVPATDLVKLLQVPKGFDAADNEIIKRIEKDDLLITNDIPLAAEALDKNAHVINPRGEPFSKQTIKAKLGMRDFMETLRSGGVETGGPPALSNKDRQAFANQLERILSVAS